MPFLPIKGVVFSTLLGGCGAITTTSFPSIKCAVSATPIRIRQQCAKLFAQVDAGEFLVCPDEYKNDGINFWFLETAGKWRGRHSYTEVKKVKLETTQVTHKDKKVQAKKVNFLGTNKSVTMRDEVVNYWVTSIDKLQKLDNLDLKEKCKITRSHNKPQINCNGFTQELKHIRYYLTPKLTN